MVAAGDDRRWRPAVVGSGRSWEMVVAADDGKWRPRWDGGGCRWWLAATVMNSGSRHRQRMVAIGEDRWCQTIVAISSKWWQIGSAMVIDSGRW